MTRLRRKNTSRRKQNLANLDLPDMLSMLHGPNPAGGISSDEITQLYKENRAVFDVLRKPHEIAKPDDTFGHFPGERCWGWWQCDAPEPRNDELPEIEQLNRLGLLSDAELRLLESNISWPPPNEYSAHLFDRPWSWWRFKSPDLREWSVSEPVQLVEMGRKHLTDREFEFIDTGIDCSGSKHTPDEFFTDEEIQYFNIPFPAAA